MFSNQSIQSQPLNATIMSTKGTVHPLLRPIVHHHRFVPHDLHSEWSRHHHLHLDFSTRNACYLNSNGGRSVPPLGGRFFLCSKCDLCNVQKWMNLCDFWWRRSCKWKMRWKGIKKMLIYGFKKARMIVTFDFASTQLSRRSCFIPYKDIDITVISRSSQQLSGHLEYSNNIWPIHTYPSLPHEL